MPPDVNLFEQLDADWNVFAVSREGDAALRRWAAIEPTLRGFATLDELLAASRGLVDTAWRDRRMLAVLRLARHDLTARRLALQVVRPALSSIARMYFGRWGVFDASSAVIVVALERIASFPTDRRHTNLAGQIACDVRHALHDELQRELGYESVFTRRQDFADLADELVAPLERTAADRVVCVVADAVRSRKITPRHAELVIASRLGGVPIEDIAAAWRRTPQTVRRMRQRAERALVGMAVA
jgi:hypothetical protein